MLRKDKAMNEYENNYGLNSEENKEAKISPAPEHGVDEPVAAPAPDPAPEITPESGTAPAADAITEDLTAPQSSVPPYTPPYNNHFANNNREGAYPPPPKAPAEFNHSGEYRYVPPYANVGANTRRPMNTPPYAPGPQPAPQRPPKEKKEKVRTVRTFPTVALVLILVGSVILSFAAGIAGALLVSGGFEMNENTIEENKEHGELIVNKNEGSEDDGSSSAVLEGEYDLTDVCAVVSASVVEITTEFNQTYYGYYQYVQEGAGSGVIISEDGYLLTNAHVITDSQSGKTADAIKVRLTNGEEYDATVIGNDSDSDIALLKIEGDSFTPATIGNSDTIEVGEKILAVGNPLGELGGTVTSGIVSATNREISVENNKMTLIQIDAAINPGNSGGGLFNTKGELIGIVNAKTTDVTVEGLGFAIPVNEAISVAEELEAHGYVTGRTHIGISLTDVTDSFTAYYYFRTEVTGVYVVNVQEGYNEEVLQYGDRITAINGDEITSSEDVKEIVKSSEVGDVLTFTISREGKLIEVNVTCYEYVPQNDVSFDEN